LLIYRSTYEYIQRQCSYSSQTKLSEWKNYQFAILLHFSFTFSQCSTGIHQAFDGQTEFSWGFNFLIFLY